MGPHHHQFSSDSPTQGALPTTDPSLPVSMKFAAALAIFLLGLTLALGNTINNGAVVGSSSSSSVVGTAISTSAVTDITKTTTITKTASAGLNYAQPTVMVTLGAHRRAHHAAHRHPRGLHRLRLRGHLGRLGSRALRLLLSSLEHRDRRPMWADR